MYGVLLTSLLMSKANIVSIIGSWCKDKVECIKLVNYNTKQESR
jgi:hypothetical protein